MLQKQTSYRTPVTTPIPIHLGAFLKMLRDRHGIAQAEVLQHLPDWQQSAYMCWNISHEQINLC